VYLHWITCFISILLQLWHGFPLLCRGCTATFTQPPGGGLFHWEPWCLPLGPVSQLHIDSKPPHQVPPTIKRLETTVKHSKRNAGTCFWVHWLDSCLVQGRHGWVQGCPGVDALCSWMGYGKVLWQPYGCDTWKWAIWMNWEKPNAEVNWTSYSLFRGDQKLASIVQVTSLIYIFLSIFISPPGWENSRYACSQSTRSDNPYLDEQ
jgi:hypothetical protein